MSGKDVDSIKDNRISENMKFEEALAKLEEAVENLESGDLPLEKSLKMYEEGVRLVRLCQKKLEQAKKKIEILVKTKNGKVKIEPFGEESPKRRHKGNSE